MKKYIGTITSYKGYKGTLIVADLKYKYIRIMPGTELHLGFSDKFTTSYIVEKWDMQSKKAFLNLANITNDAEAKSIKEYGVFIEEEILEELLDEDADMFGTIGYLMIDENDERIGEIIEYWELPANDVWLVKTDKGDLPVPVLDEYIIKIDSEGKIIKFRIPDGLLDLLEHSNNDEDNE